MNTKALFHGALCAGFAFITPSSGADPVESLLDDLGQRLENHVPGKFNLDIRFRYELFELPGNHRDGFSVRFRYGYTTPPLHGFSAMAEGETVWPLSSADQIHPLDEMGRGTELNQLWLRFQPKETGSLKLGRQLYFLDDQRFVGHVGWRQNIQTFDALTGHYAGFEHWDFHGFYMNRVNRVTGAGEKLDGFGANIRFQPHQAWAVTGYAYFLDFSDQPAWSNDTFGLRLTGTLPVEEFSFDYALALARQLDNGGSGGRDFNLGYYAGSLSAEWQGWSAGGGFEILEGDGTEGFRTPLATVHAFHGFADVFLPLAGFPQGIIDLYSHVGYKIPWGNGVQTRLIHHWFQPETGPGKYGHEVDLVVSYPINRYFNTMGKYGRYWPSSGAIAPGMDKKTMFTWDVNFVY